MPEANIAVRELNDVGRELVASDARRRELERKLIQTATQETERRFQMLVQSVTDYAIYMLDPQGNVTNWNTGAMRIKGYSESEIVGRHFSIFYTPEDRADGVPARALLTAINEGRYEAEGWRVRKDGTRFWASVVIDRIEDSNGKLHRPGQDHPRHHRAARSAAAPGGGARAALSIAKDGRGRPAYRRRGARLQ